MSVYKIYYKNGAKMMAPVVSEEEYRQLRGTAVQKQLVSQARLGNAKAKQHLLQFCYSCIPGEDGALKGCKTPSTCVGMDIDFVENPASRNLENSEKKDVYEGVRETILSKKEELGLLMLERSASKGFHLVFRRRSELSQEENLRWASQLLGVPFDEGAKDITRVFFSTTDEAEDLIFLDKEIFDLSPASPEERSACGNNVSQNDKENDKPAEGSPLLGRGKGEVSSLKAFDLCVAQAGLSPSHMDVWGEHNWHTNLMAVLSVGLPKLMSREQLEAVVAERLPNYAQTEDCKKLIAYFYDNYSAERGFMSPALREINAKAQVERTSPPSEGLGEVGPFSFMRQPEPPERPKRLPSVLKHLTSNVPERLVPTLAMSVFPALGAHLRGVTMMNIDQTEVEPSFMHLQMARSSSGKSCINKPIQCINEDLKIRDKQIKDQRREWKKACKRAGNDHRPDRPEGCKQCVTTNMTPAALTLLLYDCYTDGGRSLYSCMDEVEMLRDLNKGEGNSEGRGVSKVLRLGYDHAEWGQERVGVESVDEAAPLRWFWNASGTVKRSRSFFRTSIADGTLSRLTISTIRKRGEHTFGNYDEEWKQTLAPYITRLSAATGLIRCAEAEKVAQRLDKELDAYTSEVIDDDDVVSGWAPRAITMALMRGIVLYIAEGFQWSKEIERFMLWSYQYDMWCKFYFFGQMAEDEFGNEQVDEYHKTGPASILDVLPNSFTEEDLSNALKAHAMEGNPYHMAKTWKSRKKVTYDKETRRYTKV